jgi:RimJ/RimL family protein N-acetyltransferase
MLSDPPVAPCVRREGTLLSLREHIPSDADALAGFLGDPAVMRHMATGPLSRPGVIDVLRAARKDQKARPRIRYRLAVVRRADDAVVGTVALDLERFSSAYSHSIILRPGLDPASGFETCHLILGVAFEQLGLHRVWCMCTPDNLTAERLFLATGSTPQGMIRDFFFKDGRWHDVKTFSFLEDEWRACAGLSIREAIALRRRATGAAGSPAPMARR